MLFTGTQPSVRVMCITYVETGYHSIPIYHSGGDKIHDKDNKESKVSGSRPWIFPFIIVKVNTEELPTYQSVT